MNVTMLQVYNESEGRLRQINLVQEELTKFAEEFDKMDNWMNDAEGRLRNIQRHGGDADKLKNEIESYKVIRKLKKGLC